MLLNENMTGKVFKMQQLTLTDEELENPGDVYILRGMAETELGNYTKQLSHSHKLWKLGLRPTRRMQKLGLIMPP